MPVPSFAGRTCYINIYVEFPCYPFQMERQFFIWTTRRILNTLRVLRPMRLDLSLLMDCFTIVNGNSEWQCTWKYKKQLLSVEFNKNINTAIHRCFHNLLEDIVIPTVATSPLALRWMCGSPRTECAPRTTPYTVYVVQTT